MSNSNTTETETEMEFRDPFVDNVFRNLPENIRKGLTIEQKAALLTALSNAHVKARHFVDIRVRVPLFFISYYVVFLVGRDRRVSKGRVMIERREKAGYLAGFTFLGILFFNIMLFLFIIGFFMVYFIKSWLGIDIFPDAHLWDWF